MCRLSREGFNIDFVPKFSIYFFELQFNVDAFSKVIIRKNVISFSQKKFSTGFVFVNLVRRNTRSVQTDLDASIRKKKKNNKLMSM